MAPGEAAESTGKLWSGLQSRWVRPSDKSSVVSTLVRVMWAFGHPKEDSFPKFSPITSLLRNSKREITRTKPRWKAEQSNQSHSMATVLLWGFQKRTALNPVHLWARQRTEGRQSYRSVNRLGSKKLYLESQVNSQGDTAVLDNPTFSFIVQHHHKETVEVGQRKLILTNSVTSAKGQVTAAWWTHFTTLLLQQAALEPSRTWVTVPGT